SLKGWHLPSEKSDGTETKIVLPTRAPSLEIMVRLAKAFGTSKTKLGTLVLKPDSAYLLTE
ncbi:MAG TPA: hypothetical protein VIH58_13435, partial [Chthoniobacterales bacterium]